MDSSTHLDYILFQLTPTRTRCDLVIFAGKSNEKLAYGLLEPFVAHLKSAKDQISKGGYSLTLRPSSSLIAPWFTKATIQRFVRFVSTPEVLERFVTIEKEIAQLENSVKSYEAPNGDGGGLGMESEGNATALGGGAKNSGSPFKSKGESGDSGGGAIQEENSKVRLHRVVESRKVVLRKEQAMVYARALAAGFEINKLDDLTMFSDAFGASRLREACLNFKDLCKKKNEDIIWVDEVAAMQALVQPELSYLGTSSGIVLTEGNDPAQNPMTGIMQNGSIDVSGSNSIGNHGGADTNQDNGSVLPMDAKMQVPNPWANQFPPYLRNFQGPAYQQMPPYQGYAFRGMQGANPYYPPNMQWPSNIDHAPKDHHSNKKSSKKKDKDSKLRENEERGSSTELSGSSSETETDSSAERSHRKKHGKKSSRKVVIRNINYITSKNEGERNGTLDMDSSDEDGDLEKHQRSSSNHQKKQNGSKHLSFINGSVNQENEDASSKNNEETENWDSFNQLLLKEESESKIPEKNTEYDSSMAELSVEKFDQSERFNPAMKRVSTPEEFLFSQRTEEQECYKPVPLSDDTACSSIIKTRKGDDWFIGKSNGAVNQGTNNHPSLIVGDGVTSSANQFEKKRKDVSIDDSFMVQGRLADETPESQLRTNTSLVSDIVETSFIENGKVEAPHKKSEVPDFYEPDDIYMVRDRGSVVGQSVPSWTPEMDYENNVSSNGHVKRLPDADVNVANNSIGKGKGSNKIKGGASALGKDARSRVMNGPLSKGKTEATPAIRRSTFGSKPTGARTNLEKEEERRKRIAELALQRQKRISERCGSTGGNVGSLRKSLTGSKSVSTSPSSNKLKAQPSPVEAKKPKPILRLSTIERLAAAKTVPTSPTPPKKPASKVNCNTETTGTHA